MADASFDMTSFGRTIGAIPPPAKPIKPQRRHLIEPEFVDSLSSAWAHVEGGTELVGVADLVHAVLTQASGDVLSRLRAAGGDIKAAADGMTQMFGIDHGSAADSETSS